MNPRTSAQDVHRCELCEENMVDMLCVVCPRKLCKSCVGNHLDDDPSKHKLVKYQDRNTTLVLPTCELHSSERCKNYCQECDKAVCPSCISSDSHKKHTFLTISEICHKRKELINADTKELEEIVYPSYASIVQQVEYDAAKVEKDYKTLKQSIEKHRTEWHAEIDKIVNILQNETDKMRDTQLRVLNKHSQNVKELRSGIHEAIKSNKDVLYSPNVTKTLSYKSRNSTLKSFPEKLEVFIPKFISHQINHDLIAEMFGVIVGFSISDKIEGYKKNIQNIRERNFLDKPNIDFVLETEMKHPCKIACQSYQKMWVGGNDGSLKLFKFVEQLSVLEKQSGAMSVGSCVILKHVNVSKGPIDIAVTKTGELVYGIKFENTVFILMQDKTEMLINLYDWKFLSFCITAFDELLICMADERKCRCRVVRFNQGSDEMQIIQYDQQGKSLYKSGMLKYIEENKNGNICLADCDAGAVIVTDRTGELRFRYEGTTSTQKDDQFCPVGIATDSMAHILVSTPFQVHVIDMNGEFLRFLDIGGLNPLRLTLDKDDNLYMADSQGNVRMIQYLHDWMFGYIATYIPKDFFDFLR